jgi:putative ABC transport system substrate-binding protein
MVSAAASLVGAPARAEARPVRIGWLTAQHAASLAPFLPALRAGLAEAGLVEGRNLHIEYRFGDDDVGRVPALAQELAALPVQVLLVQGVAVPVVARLGLQVPVVFVFSGDPVEAGFVGSLARPPRGLTGVTFLSAELNGKRVELLTELVPGLSRVAVLANPGHPGEALERTHTAEVAGRLGIRAEFHRTRTASELASALAEIAGDPPGALSVFADGFALQHRERIARFAIEQRLPLVAGWRAFAAAGAVCSYGPRLADSYRRLAHYVDRILRGARAEELPVERPTAFELIVNARTAAAIGLDLPVGVLARADEVIE